MDFSSKMKHKYFIKTIYDNIPKYTNRRDEEKYHENTLTNIFYMTKRFVIK